MLRTKERTPPAAERRRQERHATTTVACHLGDVVDLNSDGMRIVSAVRPPVKLGQIAPLSIEAGGQRLSVSGQIVRIRRKSLRKFDIGVRFVDVSKSMSAALHSIALFGFVKIDSTKNGQKKRNSSSEGGGRVVATLPDYYAALGVAPGASAEEIHRAFRLLARTYHPDVCREEDAAIKFQAIKSAYDVLRDAKKRASYDLRAAG